jgi:hypothetical protein
MNTNEGDGGDDAQAYKDPSGGEDQLPSASSLSRSLPLERFLRVLVSMNIRSLIYLQWMKVFDEAVSVVHGTFRRYMRASVIPMLIKAYKCLMLIAFLVDFLQCAKINAIKALMASNQHIIV